MGLDETARAEALGNCQLPFSLEVAHSMEVVQGTTKWSSAAQTQAAVLRNDSSIRSMK